MVTASRRPSEPHVSVPGYMAADVTPIPMQPSAVFVGEGAERHISIEETVRLMAVNLDQMRAVTMATVAMQVPVFDDAAISQYEKKIDRASKWGGWVWGAISIVALVFTTGMGYSVFMGANATDSEVEAADRASIVRHNGGVDPDAIDSETHRPVGEHPDMKEAIESNAKAVREVVEEILPPMVETQKKLDKRSEYQFELGRWQSDVMEADRANRKAPGKPNKVKDLESDLALGKY